MLHGNKLIHTEAGLLVVCQVCLIISRGKAILLPGWITDENDSNVRVSIKRKARERVGSYFAGPSMNTYRHEEGPGRRAARIARQ